MSFLVGHHYSSPIYFSSSPRLKLSFGKRHHVRSLRDGTLRLTVRHYQQCHLYAICDSGFRAQPARLFRTIGKRTRNLLYSFQKCRRTILYSAFRVLGRVYGLCPTEPAGAKLFALVTLTRQELFVTEAREASGKNHSAKVTDLTCSLSCPALTRCSYCLTLL
jgi:hypothetical protein